MSVRSGRTSALLRVGFDSNTVGECFGEIGLTHRGRSGQIGDSSRHPKAAMQATPR